jgi:hypothetical protein
MNCAHSIVLPSTPLLAHARFIDRPPNHSQCTTIVKRPCSQLDDTSQLMGCLPLWPRRKQHGSDSSHVSLSVDKQAARILEATDEAAKADPRWPPPTPPAAA